MITYTYCTLKAYPNTKKAKELNALFAFYRDHVNHKINIFWAFTLGALRLSTPPKETRRGSRLINLATVKAWEIVKRARGLKQRTCPEYSANEINLCDRSGTILPEKKVTTTAFDFWVNITGLHFRNRIVIPCKKTRLFNARVSEGWSLSKSFKVIRINNAYYVQFYFKKTVAEPSKTLPRLGIDMGLTNPIATSDGKLLGHTMTPLRIKTKWRSYAKVSAIKQQVNRYAKILIAAYPETTFIFEDLAFKGKHGRVTSFRRNNRTWPYRQLKNRLGQLAPLKCFEVLLINPRNTSITCPVCGFIEKENRANEEFRCLSCGLVGHADSIAALNIARKSIVEHPSQSPLIIEDNGFDFALNKLSIHNKETLTWPD